MSRRFQFSLSALLVGAAIAAAFFAGMAAQRQLDVWRYRGYDEWLERQRAFIEQRR
ncbi:MAG TPA: hypothetical protein VG826_06170 [Pirellulales bacterium]|nr:hypothetical protein [Pirellulales bacterium]